MTIEPFTVIVDTREKEPWTFSDSSIVNGTVDAKLDTGDYGIEGLEDILCIERKRGVAEFAHNVFEKRFQDVIVRMADFSHKFILFEFSIEDLMAYPVNSGIPKAQWKYLKVKGPFMMSYVVNMQIKYGIHVIFCGDVVNAEIMAVNIMKKVVSLNGGNLSG